MAVIGCSLSGADPLFYRANLLGAAGPVPAGIRDHPQMSQIPQMNSAQNEALVLKRSGSKVQQQTNMHTSGPQIIDDLSLFDAGKLSECLDFDDHRIESDKIGLVVHS
jgi:hypothetical protein